MTSIEQQFEEDIQCIIPPTNNKSAIYISNIEAASNPATLAKFQIGAVITAIKGKNLSDVIPKHIQYLYIPAVDHQSFDISVYFQDAIAFIQQESQRTNILVHCMAGISRSVTLVIAYLMKNHNMAMTLAYNYVKSKRNKIYPNQAFLKQLSKFEQKLKLQKAHLKCLSVSNSLKNSQIQKSRSVSTNKSYVYTKSIDYHTDYDVKLRANIKALFAKINKLNSKSIYLASNKVNKLR